jgi:tripartite-type tricarboxylate transporter receptor subunit TctC
MIVIAPAGLPDDIAATLNTALKQVIESAEFKQLLEKYNMPYAYEDGASVASKFPAEIEWYTQYFKEAGLLK